MEVAFGVLGLSPDVFWRMTPGEFHAALDGYRETKGLGHRAAAAPTRAELDELMARFPD